MRTRTRNLHPMWGKQLDLRRECEIPLRDGNGLEALMLGGFALTSIFGSDKMKRAASRRPSVVSLRLNDWSSKDKEMIIFEHNHWYLLYLFLGEWYVAGEFVRLIPALYAYNAQCVREGKILPQFT